jgi:hypothetical protein
VNRRVAALALGLTLFTHIHGHWLYLRRLDTSHTLRPPLPPAPDPPSSPGARVRIVVLDGLRDDAGEQVPELRALATRGVRRIIHSEWPSYTYPNLAAMTTGVPPIYSGVRLNSGRTRVPLDTLSDVVLRAGLRVAALGQNWKHFPDRVAPGAQLSSSGDLEWIYFGEVDAAGHAHGAASRQYAEAAARAGKFVSGIAAGMDFSKEALIVLADHGHRDRGGHGGQEPEVTGAYFLAVGPGIAKGVRLSAAPMRDLAPTVARLLGVAPPRDSMGAVMTDLFGGPPPTAPDDSGYRRALAARRWGRLALVSVLLLLVAVILRKRLRFRLRDFVGWPIFAGVFFAGYFALGYPLGWSIPRGYLRFMLETGVLGIAAGALAVWVGRRLDPLRAVWQSATVVFLWALYLVLAAAAGLDMAWLEAPAVGWSVVLGATMLFHFAGALGISALWRSEV